MDSPPPSATPTDFELTAVNKLDSATQRQQKVNVQIAFSTHVGWDGTLLLLLLFGIAGLLVYITFLYTKSFQAWHRPWVWLFLVVALMYVLLSLQYLFAWKRIAQRVAHRAASRRPGFSAAIFWFYSFSTDGQIVTCWDSNYCTLIKYTILC